MPGSSTAAEILSKDVKCGFGGWFFGFVVGFFCLLLFIFKLSWFGFVWLGLTLFWFTLFCFGFQ